MAALTVNAGRNQIVLDSNGGDGTTLTLANSAPTRAATGTLNVDLSIANTVLTSTLGLTAAAQTTTQGILGYATVKDSTATGFAANVGGNIVRYTGADTLLAATNSGTTNYKTNPAGTSVTGTPYLTMTVGAHALNSLSIDTSSATGANFLDLNAQTVSLTQKGLLMTGNNDFTIQSGTLGAAATELIVHQAGTGKLTVNSQISSTTGSLTKVGTGTLELGATNVYTGVTAVNEGKLVVSGTIGNSAVTVSGAGTVLATDVAASFGSTLAINDGAILAAGDAGSAGTATVTGATTFNNGSIFSWDIDATGASYDKLVGPSLTDGNASGGSVFRIVAGDETFANAFWDSTRTWTDIFTKADTTAIANWANIFTTLTVVNSSFTGITPVDGSFSVSGNTLTWSAVPELSNLLVGGLLGAGLLRRRRNSKC